MAIYVFAEHGLFETGFHAGIRVCVYSWLVSTVPVWLRGTW
jgi:hypothetical protein